MLIPCENCLIIPICRHKGYQELMMSCDLLYESLYYESFGDGYKPIGIFGVVIRELHETLKPTYWTISKDGYVRIYGTPKTGKE